MAGRNVFRTAADECSMDMWGMTRARAVHQHICINCREEVHPTGISIYSLTNYKSTGLCEICYKDIMF